MILIVGEILCDFIEVSKNKSLIFGVNIGGAPFNVAYNLASLGVQTTFVGNVGNDSLGKYILKEALNKKNLNAEIFVRDDSDTSISFNTMFESGEKDFNFFRKNTADFKYSLKKLKEINLTDYKIVHFGSLFLSKEKARKTIENFILHCKEKNKILSFDFNYRKQSFKSTNEAVRYYKKFIRYFDIIKFNKKELLMFTNTKSIDSALKVVPKNKLIFVTLGKKGCIALIGNKTYTKEAIKVKKVDSIGAGDSFLSGILYYLNKADNIHALISEQIEEMLEFANKCGALTVSTTGALSGYSSLEDVLTMKHTT